MSSSCLSRLVSHRQFIPSNLAARGKAWTRPRLEGLEERYAPALLQVVGSGGNGTTTFDTFAQAYNASTSPGDVIQIEPSAGDVGSITLGDPRRALTIQGDPNFAIGTNVEAVDDANGVAEQRLIHLWFNGTTSLAGSNLLYDDHLVGVSEQGGGEFLNTISHCEIAGTVIIDGGMLSPTHAHDNSFLHCVFLSGAQVMIGFNVDSTLISDTIFEPSPATRLMPGGALTLENCRIIQTGASDAVAGTAHFIRDDIRSQGGTGIHLTDFPDVDVQGTAFQGNDTAISFMRVFSTSNQRISMDAGGGGHSIGGNEFVNIRVGIAVNDSEATSNLSVSANFDAVGSGVTPVAVAAGNPTVNQGMNLSPGQAFVQGLYHVYLLHTATIDELNGWVGALPSIGRQGVSFAISHSQEAYTRITDELYSQLLDREADAQGQAAFIQALQNGATEEQVIAAMLSSAEFAARANALVGMPGTDSNLNFVRALYKKILGRTGVSAAEDNSWLAALPSFGKTAVVTAFLQSQEFRGDYVASLYTAYTALPGASFFGGVPELLCRQNLPSSPEINSWANSSLNMLNIAAAISASDEFFMSR